MRRRLFAPLAAAVLALAVAAGAGTPVTPEEVEGPETWGGLEGVTHLRHLSFGGQPDREALREARARGVVAVVNLRHPSEQADLGFDEGAEVAALGMAYHQVPVVPPDLFDEKTVAAIEEAVAAHGEGHVLVHCSSGNRAGGWLALHLVGEHDMSLDDALAVGRRVGITKREIEDAARRARSAK